MPQIAGMPVDAGDPAQQLTQVDGDVLHAEGNEQCILKRFLKVLTLWSVVSNSHLPSHVCRKTECHVATSLSTKC